MYITYFLNIFSTEKNHDSRYGARRVITNMKHVVAEKINEVVAKHYSHLGVSAYQIWHPLNIRKSHGGEQE